MVLDAEQRRDRGIGFEKEKITKVILKKTKKIQNR